MRKSFIYCYAAGKNTKEANQRRRLESATTNVQENSNCTLQGRTQRKPIKEGD